ncbi:MAG: PAS domain S-box protein [Ferruginibacter sp.]
MTKSTLNKHTENGSSLETVSLKEWINNAPVALLAINRSGIIVASNKSANLLINLSNDFSNKHFYSIILEAKHQQLDTFIHQLFFNKAVLDSDFTLIVETLQHVSIKISAQYIASGDIGLLYLEKYTNESPSLAQQSLDFTSNQFLKSIQKIVQDAKDIETLLGSLCDSAIHVAGFQLAFATAVDEHYEQKRPVFFSAVSSVDYSVEAIQSDLQTVGKFLLTKKYYCCNDVESNAEISAIKPCFLKNKIQSFIYFNCAKNGTDQIVIAFYSNQKDVFSKNTIALLEDIIATIDLSLAQFKTQNELSKLTRVVNQSAASIVITDLKGNIEFVNPAFTLQTGYTANEAIGKNPRILQSTFTERKTFETMWETILNGKEWKGVFCNKKKNGELYWESAVISPIFNTRNEIINFVAIKENITDKLNADLLAANEKQLSDSIINSLPGIFHFSDINGKMLRWNKNLELITGYSTDEISNMQPTDFYTEVEKELIFERRKAHYEGKSLLPIEAHLLTKNKKQITFINTAKLIELGGQKATMVIGIDVTEKNEVEKRLRQSEAKFQAILQNISDIITLVDANGVIIYQTPSATIVLGYADEDLLGKSVFDFLHPSNQQDIAQQFALISATKDAAARVEFNFLHKLGHYVILEALGKNQLDNPDINAIVVVSRDITLKKFADEQLINERNQLLTLINNMPDSIYIKDIEARKMVTNPIDMAIMRATDEYEVLGKTDLEIFPYDTGIMGYNDDMRVIKTGEPVLDREELFITDTGAVKWLLTSKVPLRNTEGEIVGLLGIGRDITHRKATENELKESNERFEYVSKATFDAIWDWNLETGDLLWGENFELLFGYKPLEGHLNNNIWNVNLHPDDYERVAESLKNVKEGLLDNWKEEYRFKKKNGDYAYVQDRGILIRNKSGKGIRVIGALQDITAQKIAQQNLLEAEMRFRSLVENSADGLAILTPEVKVIYQSPSIEKILGYSELEGELVDLISLVHPNDNDNVKQSFEAALNNPGLPIKGNPCRMRHKNGEWRWMEYTLTNMLHISTINGIVDNFRDVTDKVLIEQKIITEKELSDSIINSLPGIFYMYDNSGKFLRWNSNFEKMTGYTADEIAQMLPTDFYEVEDIPFIQNRIQQVFTGDSPGVEVRLLTKSKIKIPFFINSRNVEYEGTKCLLGMGIDITERKFAEEENKKLGLIASLTINAVILTNIEGEITWVNKGYERMTGFKFEEVQGKKPHEILIGSETNLDTISFIEDCRKKMKGYKTEMIFYTKNKHKFWLELEVIPLFDSQNKHTGFMSIERDITERKLAEEELNKLNKNLLMHTQELADSNAELEKFAYVASHDLQEPLRMVSGFLNLLKKRYETTFDESGLQYINFAVDGANRMKQLILDLLNYSRVGTNKEVFEWIDLNLVLKDVLQLFFKEVADLGASIEVPVLPKVKANNLMMAQLFQNLIGNALKYKSDIPPAITIRWEETSSHFLFSISDNGIGIDQIYLEKIFVIFQRLHLRTEYSGTGIGLAICKKIVERHGGKIWAESDPGKGSTFHFTISKKQ